MPVVVDTSVLAAYLNPSDADHPHALRIMRAIMKGHHGLPLSSDYVLAEGLTLLRRRPGRRDVSQRFLSLFAPSAPAAPILRIQHASAEEVQQAVRLHFERYERKLSITDCVLVGLARAWSAPIASFDGGLDGLVERIGREEKKGP